jgi:hypothetical protein
LFLRLTLRHFEDYKPIGPVFRTGFIDLRNDIAVEEVERASGFIYFLSDLSLSCCDAGALST